MILPYKVYLLGLKLFQMHKRVQRIEMVDKGNSIMFICSLSMNIYTKELIATITIKIKSPNIEIVSKILSKQGCVIGLTSRTHFFLREQSVRLLPAKLKKEKEKLIVLSVAL